jgi:hypothetical protein
MIVVLVMRRISGLLFLVISRRYQQQGIRKAEKDISE